MERTLLLVVAAEAILGRLIVKGIEKKPQVVKGVPQTIVPTHWFVALDYAALFLLYFATMLAVMTLVVGLDVRREWRGGSRASSTPAPARSRRARSRSR